MENPHNSTVPATISSIPRRIGDFLFGYDFFVSYAHSDGDIYPRVLADKLQEHGYRVFLDSRVYVAGDDLGSATRRRIRMSKYLLVVVGPRAPHSHWVLVEAEQCIEANRIPIAINLDRTLEETPADNPLKQLLEDKIFIADTSSDGKGEPDPSTIARILDSFKATRQDLVRTRAITAAALSLLLAIGLASWLYLLAERRAERAQEQQALRFVADADRELFRNPQEAVRLAAQALASSRSESSSNSATEAVQRALEVISQRQDLQRESNWGSNFLQSYIAGEWFEADLGARYSQKSDLLLLTTERGASGANPPGDAIVLNTRTLETIPLDIGPAWGISEKGPGPIATFRIKADADPATIPFGFTSNYKRHSGGALVIGQGSSDVTIVVGDEDSRWTVRGAKPGRDISLAPGARVAFEIASGKYGFFFLDKQQMTNLLEREDAATEFRHLPNIDTRSRMKRRLEYVGFSSTDQKIYLARQYNIEVYRLDGTFEREFPTGGGCTKYPISLVTGLFEDRLILYGDTDGGLYRLDPHTQRCEPLGRKPGRIPISFEANADGTLGVLVFKDKTAALISIDDNLSRDSITYLPDENILTASFHPTLDNRLLTAGDDGHVAISQVSPGAYREIQNLISSGTGIGFANYSADATRVIAVDQNGRLYIWDSGTGALLQERAMETTKPSTP